MYMQLLMKSKGITQQKLHEIGVDSRRKLEVRNLWCSYICFPFSPD